MVQQKVFARVQLPVDFGGRLRRREGRVRPLRGRFRAGVGGAGRLLFRLLLQGLLSRHVFLFERRQEPGPVLVRQLGVLGQLPLDHEAFDVVDGMDVVHAVHDHGARRLDAGGGSHDAGGVSLHEHITLRQQLQGLEGGPVGTHEPLPPLHEPLPVPHHPPDLDDVAVHVVVQDLQRLGGRDRPRQQPDQVPGLHDGVGVAGQARRHHGHGALDEVQLAGDLVGVEGARDDRPHLAEVALAVFGEQAGEGALLQEGVFHHAVLPGRLFPAVDVGVVDVPRFVATVFFVILLLAAFFDDVAGHCACSLSACMFEIV
mmetsp:Transcript_28049/g.64207  ORF Transcript_28049/g.64207 Transcript_28049/m.64207 type:complete len:315 (-) Transcript_28049:156-1100(-)